MSAIVSGEQMVLVVLAGRAGVRVWGCRRPGVRGATRICRLALCAARPPWLSSRPTDPSLPCPPSPHLLPPPLSQQCPAPPKPSSFVPPPLPVPTGHPAHPAPTHAAPATAPTLARGAMQKSGRSAGGALQGISPLDTRADRSPPSLRPPAGLVSDRHLLRPRSWCVPCVRLLARRRRSRDEPRADVRAPPLLPSSPAFGRPVCPSPVPPSALSSRHPPSPSLFLSRPPATNLQQRRPRP